LKIQTYFDRHIDGCCLDSALPPVYNNNDKNKYYKKKQILKKKQKNKNKTKYPPKY